MGLVAGGGGGVERGSKQGTVSGESRNVSFLSTLPGRRKQGFSLLRSLPIEQGTLVHY